MRNDDITEETLTNIYRQLDNELASLHKSWPYREARLQKLTHCNVECYYYYYHFRFFLVKLPSFWGRLWIGWVPKKQKRKLWGTCGADFYRPCPICCPNQQFITWTSLRWPSSHITGTIFYPWIGRAKITAWSCPLRASDLIDICCLHPNCSKPAARRCCCWSKGQTDSWTDTVPSHRPSMLEVGHCQQSIARRWRDDMPTADGSSTVAKIAADLRPSADGSAVLTSLVAGGV